MTLNNSMTNKEQQVAIALIEAWKRFDETQEVHLVAEAQLQQSVRSFKELWYATDENDRTVSNIPDAFVVHYDGGFYLLRVEDNGEWTVAPIDGILDAREVAK